MKVLLCGGEKTGNIVAAVSKKFKGGNIDLIVQKDISMIGDMFERGEYFDRAVIMEKGFTNDGALKDKKIIGDRLANFVDIYKKKCNKSTTLIFVCETEEMAEVASDETIEVSAFSSVLVLKPPYGVQFFRTLITSTLDGLPQNIVYDVRKRKVEDKNVPARAYSDKEAVTRKVSRIDPAKEVDMGDILEKVHQDEKPDNLLDDIFYSEGDVDEQDNINIDDSLLGTGVDIEYSDSDEDSTDEPEPQVGTMQFIGYDDIPEETEEEPEELQDSQEMQESTEADFGFYYSEVEEKPEEPEEPVIEQEEPEQVSLGEVNAPLRNTGYKEVQGAKLESVYMGSSKPEQTEGVEDKDIMDVDTEYRGLYETEGTDEIEEEVEEEVEEEIETDANGDNLEFTATDYSAEVEESTRQESESLIDNAEDLDSGYNSLYDTDYADDEENNTNPDKEVNSDDINLSDYGVKDFVLEEEQDINMDIGQDTLNNVEELFDAVDEAEDDGLFEIKDLYDDDTNGEEYTLEDTSEQAEGGLSEQPLVDNTVQENVQGGKKTKKLAGGLFGRKNKKLVEKQKAQQPMVQQKQPQVPVQVAQPQQKPAKQKGKKTSVKPQRDSIDAAVNRLNSVMSSYRSRGCSIVFTGPSSSGKTVVSYNIAKLISDMGYNVLIVDFDTKNKGQSYISKQSFDAVHSMDTENPSLMRAINASAANNAINYADIIQPGLHLLTLGLASDAVKIDDLVQKQKIARFSSNVRNSYNFIIYDMPFEAAVGYCEDVSSTADNLIILGDYSTKGFMELMVLMSNIESEEMTETMFMRSRMCLNKSAGYSIMLGKKLHRVSDIMTELDNKVTEMLGVEAEFLFQDIKQIEPLRFDNRYNDCWLSNKAFIDFPDGKTEYIKLLCNILLNR